MIPTLTSTRKTRRRLNRLNRRAFQIRIEEVMADMAAGLALHRGLDRYRRAQWSLSGGEAIKDDVARAVIQHLCVVGLGRLPFSGFQRRAFADLSTRQ
jgi:hypothetical protein